MFSQKNNASMSRVKVKKDMPGKSTTPEEVGKKLKVKILDLTDDLAEDEIVSEEVTSEDAETGPATTVMSWSEDASDEEPVIGQVVAEATGNRPKIKVLD